ncbi:MAG: acyloxyacyl hydrolase [Bacteroidales bacterium]|nr:acyloxyacyl hydrolase [Bacteroidales bacterium]
MQTKIYLISAIINAAASIPAYASYADSIPTGFHRMPQWHVEAGIGTSSVIESNAFLKGKNSLQKSVDRCLSTEIRAGFSFNSSTREGILYEGLYQGMGIGLTDFSPSGLLGTPVSAFIYQGAPVVHINSRIWIGYEWQFGTDFGWKHYSPGNPLEENLSLSTSVTAHMGLRMTFNYEMTPRWRAYAGVQLTHSSNGNTSWPNGGVNTVGGAITIACTLNPEKHRDENTTTPAELFKTDYPRRWFYDIIAYGSTRKRVVNVGLPPERQLCPGHFAVAGFQFAPMYRINRWVATGGSLDFQWDEGAGLEPYWVEGTYHETLKFRRPPFLEQIGVGMAAHAQLTMPIFSIDAGLGYNIVNPHGDKRFYQSLTLKTFIIHRLYINIGYRLGQFRDPQNLMLGIGIRI